MFNKINLKILTYYFITTLLIFYALNLLISKTEKLAGIEEYYIEIKFFQTKNELNNSMLLKQIIHDISKKRVYSVQRIDGVDSLKSKKKTSGNIDKDIIFYNTAIEDANEIIKKIEKRYIDEMISLRKKNLHINLPDEFNKTNLNEIENKIGCNRILILDGSYAYFISDEGKYSSKNNSSEEPIITSNYINVCKIINELKSIKKISDQDLVNKLLLTSIIKDNFVSKENSSLIFPNSNFKYIILFIISLISSQIILIFYNEVKKNFSKIK